MSERFIDDCWIKGDFQKATISVSQAALTDPIWFIKYPFANYAKFGKSKSSISFDAGSKVHHYFQSILTNDFSLNEVQKDFRDYINHQDYDEKNKIKALFINNRIINYVKNHLAAVKDLTNNNLKDLECEMFFSKWYDDVYAGKKLNIETDMYLDVVSHSSKLIFEAKNRFGSVKKLPLKTKQLKSNANRIGDYVYSKPQKIKSPHFTHCIQTAVYTKSLPNYKPYLIYVDDESYTFFNENNCYELSPAGLKYFFNKYIQINVRRQEMLRMADGDIRKLAMMIGVDWSEIRNRENNPILNTIQEEDIKKLEEFYDNL